MSTVQFRSPMPITNAACCASPYVMCELCAARALVTKNLAAERAGASLGYGALYGNVASAPITEAPLASPLMNWADGTVSYPAPDNGPETALETPLVRW